MRCILLLIRNLFFCIYLWPVYMYPTDPFMMLRMVYSYLKLNWSLYTVYIVSLPNQLKCTENIFAAYCLCTFITELHYPSTRQLPHATYVNKGIVYQADWSINDVVTTFQLFFSCIQRRNDRKYLICALVCGCILLGGLALGLGLGFGLS